MEVQVVRKWETSLSVRGQMNVDGQYECQTLEPARVNPVHPGQPLIPAGRYRVELTFSPKFQKVTPEVLNVPGRSDIRWHPGNFPKDTLGCVLVGESSTTDAVLNSVKAFERLMTLLKTANEIWVEYVEAVGG